MFCIFLVIMAFLYRDNPSIVYPDVLYLFILLLTLNLAAGFALKWRPDLRWLSAGIILANCGTITAILQNSGGANSNLWVLFLLPIYTVCLLLGGAEITLITLGVICFNGIFYWLTLDEWSPETMFVLSIKTGIFIFASAATGALVRRQRSNQVRWQSARLELNRAEDRMRKQEKDLAIAEKMSDMGQITSGVAHDLNNPISVIVGSVRLLLEDDRLSISLRQDLERISRAADLCRNITANLLEFAREHEFVMAPTDIDELVRSALSIYETTLKQSRIQVSCELAGSLPPIAASVPHIQRILLNLLSNARAAMPDGGRVRIRTEAQTAGGQLWITVTVDDSGPGISEEIIQKLFRPFSSTKGADGNGLGLYLSREIAQKHGGRLNAENVPGGGARFVLTLPALAGERAKAA